MKFNTSIAPTGRHLRLSSWKHLQSLHFESTEDTKMANKRIITKRSVHQNEMQTIALNISKIFCIE